MDTSKATGRPWVVGLTGEVVTDDCVMIPPTTDMARMIVERVNGWDALVAERDALKANLESVASHRRALLAERDALRDALRALHERCHEYSTIGPGDWAGYDRSPEAKAARAALGKGAGA